MKTSTDSALRMKLFQPKCVQDRKQNFSFSILWCPIFNNSIMWDPVEHRTLTRPLEIMLTWQFCKSCLYTGNTVDSPYPWTNACAKSVPAIMVEIVCIFNAQGLFTASWAGKIFHKLFWLHCTFSIYFLITSQTSCPQMELHCWEDNAGSLEKNKSLNPYVLTS